MALDFGVSPWQFNGATTDAGGTHIIEDSSSSVHMIYQNAQGFVDDGLGTSAVMFARVTPVGRTKCWIGCRQNNGFYMASFNLTGAGTVEVTGSNVTSASIVNNGDGSYTCTVIFSGTFSSTATVFAIGSLLTAGNQEFTGTNGLHALTVTEAQLTKGTTPKPYAPQTDRSSYLDQQTADGSQDFDLPGSNLPNILNPDYILCDADNGLQTPDFTFSLDDFTAVFVFDWDGDTSSIKILGAQWDGINQNSWIAYLDTAGKFIVAISDDGTSLDKQYEAVTPVSVNERTLAAFTWDGSALRMYYNDVELTVASGELVKDTDNAASGALFNSTVPPTIYDNFNGKAYNFYLYEGAATPANISTIAAGLGLSGIPGGTTPAPNPQIGDYVAVNNIIVIEAESFPIAGTDFVIDTTEPGYTGDSYIRYDAADDFTLPPADVISVDFYVPTAGLWQISLRHNHDPAPADDQENDCWLDVPTANDSAGFEKWGHNAPDYGNGFTFATFREPSPSVFLDKWFDLDAGSHTLQIGGRSNNWRFDRVHIWNVAANPADKENASLPESPQAGGGGGNIPTTTQELINYLTDEQGLSESNIFYVNNASGSDSNSGTPLFPWATIQKAANTLTAGQAVIIQGDGGRYYESVTPGASGTAGNLIWFCGDPESPAIVDGSQDFTPAGGSNWTSEGGGMYSAPYGLTRPFNEEQAYFSNCTIPANCRSRSTYMSHQLIYNDQQLIRISQDDHTANPTLNAGECFFECSGNTDNDYKTPTRVWCRLPGDIDPDTVEMRVGSDKLTLFDYSPNVWPVDGTNWPGGSLPNDRRAGRSYLGLVNLHFKYSGLGRKIGPVIFRGTGWFAEWCSFSDANTEAASFAGDNHTIRNCKFVRFGKGLKGDAFQQDSAGQSLFSKCLFQDGNIHQYPEAWDAGFKVTDGSGNGGTIVWEDCLFKDIAAPGFWTDINCGNANGSQEAFRFTRCIFEACGRHAVFMENNSYYLNMEHCGIWNTQYSLDGQAGQELASGLRIAGSGRNTLTNCAIVYNQGKGWYMKPDDTRASAHGANQDTVTNCVFVENARDERIELQRCEIHGGNYQGGSAEDWNTSDFNNNVFFNSLPTPSMGGSTPIYFYETTVGGTNNLSTFEAATTSSGNVIAASAGAVVSDHTDRKEFWKTAGGSYPTKGPQSLVHYEDQSETGWSIAGLTIE